LEDPRGDKLEPPLLIAVKEGLMRRSSAFALGYSATGRPPRQGRRTV